MRSRGLRNRGYQPGMFETVINQFQQLADTDMDGVPDHRDCRPYNPFMHKIHKQKSLTPGKITQAKFTGGYGDPGLREIKKEKTKLKQIKGQSKIFKFVEELDTDGDGVPDYKDCDPFDPEKDLVEFLSPPYGYSFQRGHQRLHVMAQAESLPRNAILIRPYNIADSPGIYQLLKEEWMKGTFRSPMLSHGSCQHFIKTGYLKDYFEELATLAAISCIDNINDVGLQKGDILLTRHGVRTIGQPFLITEE